MRFCLAAALILLSSNARAEVPLPPARPSERFSIGVPLPIPRPEVQGPPLPHISAEPFGPPWPIRVPPSATAKDRGACDILLKSGKIAAERQDPVIGPDGCGIAAPIRLHAIVMPNGREIGLEPPALLRCDLADRLADWLREDFAAADPKEGALIGLVDAAAYGCRSRNHVPGAPLSEHARGNAIDILAFRFGEHVVGLKDAASTVFLSKVKQSACARFSTVLGPGSDGYHEDNLHLDLEMRKSGSHYCHWQ